MGGRGSGRKKKPLRFVIREMKQEIYELNHDVWALHKKVDTLASRLNYWLKKVEKRIGS